MSRTFDDSLTADLEAVFFNTNEFAKTVTIARATVTTENVPAIVVEREYQINDDAAMLQIQSIDFEILKTDYVFNSVEYEPRDGDRITFNGAVHQVLPLDMKTDSTRQQSHSLVGGDGKIWRIHTKRMR